MHRQTVSQLLSGKRMQAQAACSLWKPHANSENNLKDIKKTLRYILVELNITN